MLMDRHGTSRVLFRNTRNGVKGSRKRTAYGKLPLPTQYFQTAITKVSGIMGARKSAEDRAAICLLIRNKFIRSSKAILAPGGTSTTR